MHSCLTGARIFRILQLVFRSNVLINSLLVGHFPFERTVFLQDFPDRVAPTFMPGSVPHLFGCFYLFQQFMPLRKHDPNGSMSPADSPDDVQEVAESARIAEYIHTLGPASLNDLDELKRRYAAFIIQIDRLRPALYRADSRGASRWGTWSLRETLGHLIDTDRDIWWPRIEAARLEENPYFEDINQSELLRAHHWKSQPLEDILSQLVRSRWDYGMKLNSFSASAFERTGEHAILGELSILRILQIMVAHDEYYLTKIRALTMGVLQDGME